MLSDRCDRVSLVPLSASLSVIRIIAADGSLSFLPTLANSVFFFNFNAGFRLPRLALIRLDKKLSE